MIIALTVWDNRISPLCDSAGNLLLMKLENGTILSQHHVAFPEASPFDQLQTLIINGVDVLVCGAITRSLFNLFERHNIGIISFITGNVTEVIDAYLTNQLSADKFAMPGLAGCRKQQSGSREKCGMQRRRGQATKNRENNYASRRSNGPDGFRS